MTRVLSGQQRVPRLGLDERADAVAAGLERESQAGLRAGSVGQGRESQHGDSEGFHSGRATRVVTWAPLGSKRSVTGRLQAIDQRRMKTTVGFASHLSARATAC